LFYCKKGDFKEGEKLTQALKKSTHSQFSEIRAQIAGNIDTQNYEKNRKISSCKADLICLERALPFLCFILQIQLLFSLFTIFFPKEN